MVLAIKKTQDVSFVKTSELRFVIIVTYTKTLLIGSLKIPLLIFCFTCELVKKITGKEFRLNSTSKV